jgi:hypothetical protein
MSRLSVIRDVAKYDKLFPASRVFPESKTVEGLLQMLGQRELQGIWTDDEAMGWLYQGFTPKAERDKARRESPAPRNSHELAFLKQFSTPRYVVQFLVENALGRLWYEMRHGNTRLKDDCRYLVRRPAEVFLPPGYKAEGSGQQAGVSVR